ncbi:hypothetical protein M3Y99_01355100 [Aphelenchoides fujianensis]|nr:hypothetical protein M3Y99_01355100 [Aphelenchoides fujianensis]
MSDAEPTNRNVITVDMINNLRLVDSDTTEISEQMKTQGERFLNGFTSLESQIAEIRSLFRDLGQLADRERMRAMSALNDVATAETHHMPKELLHLHASIQEKTNELEIAKQQLENLKQLEAKQIEFIRRLQSMS